MLTRQNTQHEANGAGMDTSAMFPAKEEQDGIETDQHTKERASLVSWNEHLPIKDPRAGSTSSDVDVLSDVGNNQVKRFLQLLRVPRQRSPVCISYMPGEMREKRMQRFTMQIDCSIGVRTRLVTAVYTTSQTQMNTRCGDVLC